jgi:hypothetical protein
MNVAMAYVNAKINSHRHVSSDQSQIERAEGNG